MKKIVTLISLLALCLCLCSCSGSGESADYISGIVSKIESIISQSQPEEEIDPEQAMVGVWVDEISEDKIILNADMTYKAGSNSGTWRLTDDKTILHLCREDDIPLFTIPLIEEDGYTKLNRSFGLYVRAEERQEILDKKFVVIQMNSIEYGNYLGELKFVGNPPNNWSSFRSSFFMFESLLSQEGLIYANCSSNFKMFLTAKVQDHAVPVTYTSPFDFITTDRTTSETLPYEIEMMLGKIYYVRPEYVENIIVEDSSRTLVMKADYEIYDHAYNPWGLLPNVNPDDFKR